MKPTFYFGASPFISLRLQTNLRLNTTDLIHQTERNRIKPVLVSCSRVELKTFRIISLIHMQSSQSKNDPGKNYNTRFFTFTVFLDPSGTQKKNPTKIDRRDFVQLAINDFYKSLYRKNTYSSKTSLHFELEASNLAQLVFSSIGNFLSWFQLYLDL